MNNLLISKTKKYLTPTKLTEDDKEVEKGKELWNGVLGFDAGVDCCL